MQRNLKQEQCQIRLNLVAAIAVAQILFLAGINATSKKVSISNYSCRMQFGDKVFFRTCIFFIIIYLKYLYRTVN